VNPKHLFLGTNEDNMKDKVRKGRQARGEKNGRSKLTVKEVRTIRKLNKDGGFSYRQLAERFRLSPSYVGCIVREEYWKLPLAE
jgi:DNA-binding MarR family transcriptional regulator